MNENAIFTIAAALFIILVIFPPIVALFYNNAALWVFWLLFIGFMTTSVLSQQDGV